MLPFEEVDLDTLPDRRLPSPERSVELAIIRDEVRRALQQFLPKHYLRIVELWSGINCPYAMTLEEIARSLRVSRERIAGLVAIAHNRLRLRCPDLARLLVD